MLELIPMEHDAVVGIRIDGGIRHEDIEAMDAEVADRLERHERIRVYAEVVRLGGIEPEALFKDLKMGLDYWDKVERKAAVTDARWMRRIADLVDPLFPSVELRAFPRAEAEDARRWLHEGLDEPAG